MRIRTVGAVCAVALLGVAAAACGSSSKTSSSSTTTSSTAAASSSKTASAQSCHVTPVETVAYRAKGTIRVLAAASLTEAFTNLAHRFEAAHPGVKVETSFGASSTLVAQVNNGAPADVLATADTQSMTPAAKSKSVNAAATFACNRLEIIVAKGNPKHITSLSDLGKRGVRLVLCAKGVPCGDLAMQAFAKAGVDVKPAGYQSDVKHVVAQVETGEADAGIVYVTDVMAANAKASGVPIAPADDVVASDPIALVNASSNQNTAKAFIQFVLSDGQQVLARYGFRSS